MQIQYPYASAFSGKLQGNSTAAPVTTAILLDNLDIYVSSKITKMLTCLTQTTDGAFWVWLRSNQSLGWFKTAR